MKLNVVLDTKGVAAAGVDQNELIADIQAEVDKLASQLGSKPIKPRREQAPETAQTDMEILQWLIDIATDPEMARSYARVFIYSINSILTATKSRESNPDNSLRKNSGKRKSEDSSKARVEILGKKILLPTTARAIKAILKELGEE